MPENHSRITEKDQADFLVQPVEKQDQDIAIARMQAEAVNRKLSAFWRIEDQHLQADFLARVGNNEQAERILQDIHEKAERLVQRIDMADSKGYESLVAAVSSAMSMASSNHITTYNVGELSGFSERSLERLAQVLNTETFHNDDGSTSLIVGKYHDGQQFLISLDRDKRYAQIGTESAFKKMNTPLKSLTE